MEHVVFCDKKNGELENIINGKQTMIIRATQSRRIPHSRVFKGENLYFLNKNSNEIKYKAEVKEVFNYNKLFDREIRDILNKNYLKLCLSEKNLEKYHKKCICLVEFFNLEEIVPIKIKPQAPLVDWIILQNINDIENSS